MRQTLKLEKEAAMKNLNNSKIYKETKSPKHNQKPNIRIMNYNPYGTNITVNKPSLQSNYMYNMAKKEKENIENQERSKLTESLSGKNK